MFVLIVFSLFFLNLLLTPAVCQSTTHLQEKSKHYLYEKNKQFSSTEYGCTIDRVENMTADLFFDRYYLRKPVIWHSKDEYTVPDDAAKVSHFSTEERSDKDDHSDVNRLSSMPSRKNMTDLGDHILLLLRTLYADTIVHLHSATELGAQEALQGGHTLEMTLENYLDNFTYSENRPFYLFDEKLLKILPEVEALITSPSLSGRKIFEHFEADPILALGTTGSGLPFHYHRQNWCLVLHGQKLWHIYAPGEFPPIGYSPWETHGIWINKVLPVIKKNGSRLPLTCTQRAGEVIYIPTGWHHAVTNMELTLAVTQQPVEANVESFYSHLMDFDAAKREGDLEMARLALEKSIGMVHDARAYAKLGSILEKLGDIGGALDAHRRSIELNRRHPASYIELAGILMDHEEYESALSVLGSMKNHGSYHPAVRTMTFIYHLTDQIVAAAYIIFQRSTYHQKKPHTLSYTRSP